MQTHLAEWINGTPAGAEADAELRKCVHCGFCNATCPTYQLLGDELDGPRGRIYLIKQVLEGVAPTQRTQLHLDRCLTCRACETTCPSGVQYGRLVDIGRELVEKAIERPVMEKLQRRLLAAVLPRRAAFSSLLGIGRAMRGVLPPVLADKIPASVPQARPWPAPRHGRRMLALAGCVQPSLSPDINAAAARVLDRVGISLLENSAAGCCGALRYHLNFQADGLDDMRRVIDAWWPAVERGEVEAIVMTASGCGVTVKEYGHLLAGDSAYRDKAARISAMTRDISEVLESESAALSKQLGTMGPSDNSAPRRIAFHSPCTLQHGQQLSGVTERLLRALGFELCPVPDAHLCCGSAGTYAITQPALSKKLRDGKLAALQSGRPAAILTANIGCQNHLAGGTSLSVRHWIVALDEHLAEAQAQ
jgi:glycolate oxidase iron-sulfur subunit